MPKKSTSREEIFAEQRRLFPDALAEQPSSLPTVTSCLRDRTISPIFYTSNGALFHSPVEEFSDMIGDDSIDAIFADPPYNIGKADWDEFDSLDSYLEWTGNWISECYRILKHNGSMYVMGFPEILAHVSIVAGKIFASLRWLVWHYRNKPNLGSQDWVRSHESILHLRKGDNFHFDIRYLREPYNAHTRKYPERAQGVSSQYGNGKEHVWSPNLSGAKPRDVIDIPAISNGMKESTSHPTQKPEELLRRLILAVTREKDVVFDPFGGSGTTYVVCEQLGRAWLGSEKIREYCEIAAVRLMNVPSKPVGYWVDLDRKRQLRRRRIRGGE